MINALYQSWLDSTQGSVESVASAYNPYTSKREKDKGLERLASSFSTNTTLVCRTFKRLHRAKKKESIQSTSLDMTPHQEAHMHCVRPYDPEAASKPVSLEKGQSHPPALLQDNHELFASDCLVNSLCAQSRPELPRVFLQ